jgi:FSR family fosmidomycin resistance protein-like MFS transporter
MTSRTTARPRTFSLPIIYIPRHRLFWAVSVGHLTNDTFMSMASVLLAFISVNVLPLSKVQIGLILGIAALVGAVTQPIFGLLADRSGGRWLGAGGVAWTVGFTLLAIVAADNGIFPLMMAAFIIPAVGNGAFHPVGAKYAAESDHAHTSGNMAYFFLLGQLGLALGPALAGRLLDHAGTINHVFTDSFGPDLQNLLIERGTVAPVLWVGLLAVPIVLLMAFYIPNRNTHLARKAMAQTAAAPVRAAVPMLAFVVLLAMVVLRSLAQPGIVSFIPVLFQEKGWTPAEYGLITSSFWIGAGLAGVFFGTLADRYDRRKVIAFSMIASAPAFFFLPVMDGPLAFGLAIAAGTLSGASHSIIVVLAQGFIPGSKALASGLILGLIFGVGALGSFLIGGLAEAIGLNTVFQIAAGSIVAASLLALALPRDA